MDADELYKIEKMFGRLSDEYRYAATLYATELDKTKPGDTSYPSSRATRDTPYEEALKDIPKMSGESRSAIEDLMRITTIKPKRGRHRAPPSREEFLDLAEKLKREEATRIAREKSRADYARESERYYEKLKAEREEEGRAREKAYADAERARREEERTEREAADMRERARHQPTSFIPSTYGEVAVIAMNPAKACIVLRAQLSKEFVIALNDSIAIKHRWWNGQDQVYEFHASVMPALKILLKQYYSDTQVMGAARPVPGTKFDKLMLKLTTKDKADIYRLLATRYHPDRGGDHEVMSLVNQVFKEK